MDTLMVIVTVLALAMAVAMTFVAVKLLRQERQRSDARVAALAHLSEEPAPAPVRQAETRHGEIRATDLPLQPLAPAAAVASAHDLFSEHVDSSPWPRRLLAAGAVVTVILVFSGLLALGGRHTPDPPPAATVAAPAPLELLSLRYEQAASGLIVTGLVQNPAGGKPTTHVTATVFAFAQDGTFLASGRAPVEFATLEPGDQSPFVVTVPTSGGVARYRVGFRAEDGHVLAHLDKRQPESIARR